MSDLAAQLGRTALCCDLTPEELERVADSGRLERWPQDGVVMEEGASGPRLVILLQGRCAVTKEADDGSARVLAEVGPGSVLGEMSLLVAQPRSATVIALTPLQLFAMDRNTFHGMVEQGDPAALKMGMAIARVLAQRVTALNDKVLDLLEHVPSDEPIQEFSRYRQQLFTRWDF